MNAGVKPTAGLLARLLCLRGDSSALPDSNVAVVVALALLTAVHVGGAVLLGELSGNTWISVAITLAFLTLLPALILGALGRGDRWRRLVLALAAIETASALIATPGVWLLRSAPQPSWPLIVAVAVSVVLIVAWAVAAEVRVWRQATAWPTAACAALVLATLIAQLLLRWPLGG